MIRIIIVIYNILLLLIIVNYVTRHVHPKVHHDAEEDAAEDDVVDCGGCNNFRNVHTFGSFVFCLGGNIRLDTGAGAGADQSAGWYPNCV